MEKKYNDFITNMSNAGWTISIKTNENKEIEGWICHDSWVTDNLYASKPLPTFSAHTIENLLDNIMDYFNINNRNS